MGRGVGDNQGITGVVPRRRAPLSRQRALLSKAKDLPKSIIARPSYNGDQETMPIASFESGDSVRVEYYEYSLREDGNIYVIHNRQSQRGPAKGLFKPEGYFHEFSIVYKGKDASLAADAMNQGLQELSAGYESAKKLTHGRVEPRDPSQKYTANEIIDSLVESQKGAQENVSRESMITEFGLKAERPATPREDAIVEAQHSYREPEEDLYRELPNNGNG